MQKLLRISFILTFIACLIIGFLAGSTFIRSKHPPVRIGARRTSSPFPAAVAIPSPSPPPPASPVSPTSPPPTAQSPGHAGQQNILVIGIDNLDALEPRLESIWLVLNIPPSPSITLIPLYPSPQDSSNQDNKLASAFHLTPHGAPDPAFLATLQARDLWWSAYTVLDEAGLAGVVELIAGAERSEDQEAGRRAVGSLTPPWEDPATALLSQTVLLQSLCRKSIDLPASLDLGSAVEMISKHMITDLDLPEVIAAGQKLLASGSGLSCQFPTLSSPQNELKP